MGRNVILIGMMGCGKTTIGHILARKLGRAFLDTDRAIERRSGQTVAQLFAERGEEAFRQLETELLRELAGSASRTVVACGGGIVLRTENQRLMQRIGPVIWLRMSADNLVLRLRHSRRQGRPLLQTEDWPAVVRRLVAERDDCYRRAADITLQADGLSPEQAAVQIQRMLRAIEGRR